MYYWHKMCKTSASRLFILLNILFLWMVQKELSICPISFKILQTLWTTNSIRNCKKTTFKRSIKSFQKISIVTFDGTFDSFCDMLKRSSKGIWQVYSCPYSCISPWQKKSTFDVKNFTFDVKSKIFDIKSWFFWQCESSFRTKTKCSLSSTKFLLNLNMKLPRTHMANYLRKCFRKCNLIASLLVKLSNHQN